MVKKIPLMPTETDISKKSIPTIEYKHIFVDSSKNIKKDSRPNTTVSTGYISLSSIASNLQDLTFSSAFFMTKEKVKKIARLANISLMESEILKHSESLNYILNYIEVFLKHIDTNGIKETSQTTNLENVTKKDLTAPSLSSEEALSNTKSKHNDLFKVKAIFE